MKRTLTVGTALVTLIAVLGCSGLEEAFDEVEAEIEKEAAAADEAPASGGGNKAACVKYVEHHNAQPCLKIAQLNAGDMCPDALDMNPKDMSKMYDCMRENTKCNGNIPDLAEVASCSSL